MSTKDLSILSYKELQALAVRHRVPGNIKKLLLVKILHAVKSGNSSEVTKLLTDLKKNRKKRTKRVKIMKADEDETHSELQNNSPYIPIQQDNYLFPMQQPQQQQYPFQWVGAEEEVRCSLNYNDIRQFIFLNCDRNNNKTLVDQIVDLRTEATVSNYRSSQTENGQIINSNPHPSGKLVTDTTSKKMSLLLKKMLQAPVGANLGEIASPITTWPIETCRLREQSPDDSETVSAKSDINEHDEIWQDTITGTMPDFSCTFENEQSCMNLYDRRNNDLSYYKSSLDNMGGDENILGYGQEQVNNQYQFNFALQSDAQENCRNWLVSNPLDHISSAAEIGRTSNLKITPTLQCLVSETADVMNQSSGDSSCIAQPNADCCTNNHQLYSTGGCIQFENSEASLNSAFMNIRLPESSTQNKGSSLLEPSDLLPDLQFDVSRYYQTPINIIKTQEPLDYYRQICTASDFMPIFSQDLFDDTHEQQISQHQQSKDQIHNSRYTDYTELTAPIYHVELETASYDPGHYHEQHPLQNLQQPDSNNDHQQIMYTNQSLTVAIPTAIDPLKQLQDQQFENLVSVSGTSISQDSPLPTYGAGVLEPYWPRWSFSEKNNRKANGQSLEITLNFRTSNCIDFSKLNETCCVYSNKTPVMTLRKGLNSVPLGVDSKSTGCGFYNAENRQHNFASNWLLYNEDSNSDINGNNHNFAHTCSSSLVRY